MRARGPWLGDLLERRGAIARDQLLRALRNQKVVGGKLGTCLLEIDALPEEALLAALSEQQGAPSVSPEELRGVQRAVLDLVPAKVARAHHVVPFHASGTQIHVAMIDARDLHALDELSFVTGRRVVAHVASEVRLLEALDRFYGLECPQRFVKLLDRMNRSRFLWRTTEESPPPEEMLQWDPGLGGQRPGEAPIPPPAPPLREPEPPLAATPAQVAPGAAPAPARTAVPALPQRPPHQFVPRPPAPPQPPPAPQRPAPPQPPPAPRPAAPAPAPAPAAPPTLAEAERRLLEPEDPDAVGATLVDFAAACGGPVALFQVRKNEVVGWIGKGLDAARLKALRVPLDRPSLFFALHEGAAIHLGPLADLPAHVGLRALLGASAAGGDLVALPLRVRERLVSVLLVAPAAGAHAAPGGKLLSELQRIVAKASIALELCIMRKKLRKA